MSTTSIVPRTWKRRIAGIVSATLIAITGATVTSMAAPAPAQAATCTSYNYSYGGNGTCVRYIQTLLNWQPGIDLVVDGAYGNLTRQAVIARQTSWRYWDSSVVVDGIVGPRTWAYLCSPYYYGTGPAQSYPFAVARAAGCRV
ncbi:peptidoglycan-binding domain-containing protein [Nocardioides sp. YJ-D4]